MSDTIFPVLSMSRGEARWENHLYDLTPVEEHQGMYFKREDYFAPLGYGGINGSKCRQIIWLIHRAAEKGKEKLISGASLLSPQLSMSTIVGKHMGMNVELVVGATKPNTAALKPNVQAAARFGAGFHIIPVAYNPALQREVLRRTQADPTAFSIEYGITLCHKKHSPEEIVAFHDLGARQVQNIPPVKELIVPAGSCNTLVSVLYGIAKYKPAIGQLGTLGIGPDKMRWVHERLRVIEKQEGLDIIPLFKRTWPQYEALAKEYERPYGPRIEWAHYNLQTEGYSSYSDSFAKESHDGIQFHPTYEAKMWRWGKEHNSWASNKSQCFWIVGSAPQLSVLEPFFPLPHQEKIHVL